MNNLAILVGNTSYRALAALPCCHDDILAMKELLEATGKFLEIKIIENATADDLKANIRYCFSDGEPKNELFFYFTGHGEQTTDDFYYCSTNYDRSKPNETGLSNSELHTLLRMAGAQLVVKVIDACNSGTLLVKSNGVSFPSHRDGFNHLLQFSSCLNSQESLVGDPCSLFTTKFRAAALRKEEGPVLYSDILNTLRDAFLGNETQTPLFVTQGTGREEFVDNASRLDGLRRKYSEKSEVIELSATPAVVPPPSLLTLLQAKEAKLVKPDQMRKAVGSFFDNLIAQLALTDFDDYFRLEVTEHSTFNEITTRDFIIRCLSREQRNDEFVTATITRERKRPASATQFAITMGLYGMSQEWVDVYDLELNCKMERAQVKFTVTPKFSSLKRLTLVVTCAPSLECCYFFEFITAHSLRDFEAYSEEGSEVLRRWYERRWSANHTDVVSSIAETFKEKIRGHLQTTEKALNPQST